MRDGFITDLVAGAYAVTPTVLELITREDGSPRVSATWKEAQTGFASGLLDE